MQPSITDFKAEIHETQHVFQSALSSVQRLSVLQESRIAPCTGQHDETSPTPMFTLLLDFRYNCCDSRRQQQQPVRLKSELELESVQGELYLCRCLQRQLEVNDLVKQSTVVMNGCCAA